MAKRGNVINFVTDDLQAYQDDTKARVKTLIIDTITQVEIMSNRSLTENSSAELNLNFINVEKRFKKSGFRGEVGVLGDNNMAAYIEFGTGLFAKEILSVYPKWIQDIAMQFFVNGRGTIEGKPYLYNNFLIAVVDFEIELEKIMKRTWKSRKR